MRGTITSIKRYGLKKAALVEVETDTGTVQVDAYSFIGTVGSQVEFDGEQLRKDGPIVVVNLWAENQEERSNTPAEIEEMQRVNELEMWGPQGRPQGIWL